MICDQLELTLCTTPETLTDAERAHLGNCERCQAFAADARAVVALAAMPAPSAETRVQLAGLAPRALQGWARQGAQRGSWRRVLGYALAAGLGALVASVLHLANPRVSPVAPARVAVAASDEAAEFASADGLDEDLNVAPEEVFFEVTWPSPEGEFL